MAKPEDRQDLTVDTAIGLARAGEVLAIIMTIWGLILEYSWAVIGDDKKVVDWALRTLITAGLVVVGHKEIPWVKKKLEEINGDRKN